MLPIRDVGVHRSSRSATIHKVMTPEESSADVSDPSILDREGSAVIALIAHDEKKAAMKQFVMEYERPLRTHFSRILCTGTMGQHVKEAAP